MPTLYGSHIKGTIWGRCEAIEHISRAYVDILLYLCVKYVDILKI